MRTLGRLTLAALVLVAGLLTAQTASAGPIYNYFFPSESQPSDYSHFRYWTPGLARLHDDLHGPQLSVYAPDRHPEVPPTFIILTYPCPAVPASATLIVPPTPPADSRSK